MKKFILILIALGAIGLVVRPLSPPKNRNAFDVVGFSRLPVLANGRLKPLDTVARSSLLQIEHKQAFPQKENPDASLSKRLRERFKAKPQPIEWLLDVIFRPELADAYQVFEIVHPDVLTLFTLKTEDGRDGKRFALNQLIPKIGELERQAKLAEPIESGVRNAFQRAVLQLYGNLQLYQSLKHMAVMPARDDFLGELLRFQDNVATGVAAVRAKQAGQPYDAAAFTAMTDIGERFVIMANTTHFRLIPPDAGNPDVTAWKPAGAALLETFQTGRVHPAARGSTATVAFSMRDG